VREVLPPPIPPYQTVQAPCASTSIFLPFGEQCVPQRTSTPRTLPNQPWDALTRYFGLATPSLFVVLRPCLM
jgi:hypothetical protein